VKHERHRKPRPPLDAEGLERLGLFYAGRYATTRAKLASYLSRKVKERGWEGPGEPQIDAIVARFSEIGYVDDRAFASARAASLQRRGYGARRLDQVLHGAGIEAEDSAEAREQARSGAWEAAVRFAERKRLGPFAAVQADRATRHKALASMLRAGHSMDIARRLLDAAPGSVPDPHET